ncbi:hypothetical protein [Humibacter sp. RRB41]|uniref:hypothetical protein n=1 Tax=Humibacter sp. RRB41 TaxID=2919946 RepID=UPI001FAB1A23|nr:hypothetical protein [Humibacter sp. RRB41]
MTSDLDSGGESPTERRRRRSFRVRLWVGTACYLLASFALFEWGHATSPWRVVWAVLPLLFMVWVIVVIVLRVRRLDEYQVKLLFPGLAVGFTVAMFAAVTLGTLSGAGFDVPNAGWPVALIGIVAWEFTNLVTGASRA